MILLDTHVLVWSNTESVKLSREARRLMEKARRQDGLAISAISLWELALLVSRGRIQSYGSIEFSTRTFAEGVTIKPITAEIAALAAQFPDDFPRDPVDRIIGATARAEGMTLITRDERLLNSSLLKTVW